MTDDSDLTYDLRCIARTANLSMMSLKKIDAAADEIERLQARIEELEVVLREIADGAFYDNGDVTIDENERLQARVKELEMVLREIADGAFYDNGDVTMNHGHMIRAFFKARAAVTRRMEND